MDLKTCTTCEVEKELKLFVKSGKGENKYRAVCKDCWNKYIRNLYYKTDYRETRKKYKKANKEKLKKYYNEYMKKRKKEDPLFKMKVNLRSLITGSFKNKGFTKESKVSKILGCDFEFFKEYIEHQFSKNMNWDNIHLDHIKPLSSATSKKEIIELNHYTNFQPLLAKDNIIKYNSLIEKQLKLL
jgi:hypothetical protein